MTKLSEKLDPIGTPSFFEATYEPCSEVDLEDFLRNERMNAMCAIVEATSTSVRRIKLVQLYEGEIVMLIFLHFFRYWKRFRIKLICGCRRIGSEKRKRLQRNLVVL